VIVLISKMRPLLQGESGHERPVERERQKQVCLVGRD
jgi:hypothetical protein